MTQSFNFLISKFARLLKKILVSNKESKKIANEDVIKYYNINRNKKVEYIPNVWNKNKYWDFFLQSLPHSVKSKYYVPRDYYAIALEPGFKNDKYSDFANEKNYYDKLFSNFDIILPKTYLRCINNTYLDAVYNKIDDYETILNRITDDLIIKSSSGGSGVNILKFIYKNDFFYNGSGEKLNLPALQRFFNGNFIVQECIKQHKDIAKFHPGSLNTIRAITYRSLRDNEIYVISAMLRIGKGGKSIDNISAGGIAVGIELEKNGLLKKYAFDKYGNYWEKHPDTGIIFEGEKIPFFDTIVETLKKLGYFLGHNRIIGWDVTVDNAGHVILIEPNIGIGAYMSQVADGRPLFGDFSEEVFNYMKSIK